MNLKLPSQYSSLKKASSFLIVFLLFLSCKKDIDDKNTEPNNTPPDLVTKVKSSVSGFVTDQNDAAVVGASVKMGTASTTTDRYGYFELKNTEVVKEAATVMVTQAGYFKGIKTYMAAEDKAAFFRIKLLQKTIAGNISSSSGGSVSLSNGLKISLPANAVKNAATGAVYMGTVNVAAQYLDPTSEELTKIMPGDLRGINSEGNIKGLTSFGMMAVELTGSSGELLHVADGKKSTITMPMPVSISSDAPTSIPLWYFDEVNGLWKEEGTAIKTGNSYAGEVSHFSWWNCDLPNAIVPLTFSIISQDGKPLNNVHVEIFPLTNNSWSHIGGYTDSTGYVSVFVTPNARYSLTVFDNCGSTVVGYSHNFDVANSPVDLGNVILTGAAMATVSGFVTDCSNQPLSNGYIILRNNNVNTRYPLSNMGAYNFSTMLCGGTTNTYNLIAADAISFQQSLPLNYSLVPGQNPISNLQVPCVVPTSDTQYVNFTINGKYYSTYGLPGNYGSCTVVITATDSIKTQVSFNQMFNFDNGTPSLIAQALWAFWSYADTPAPGTPSFIYFLNPFLNDTPVTPHQILPELFNTNFKTIPLNITEYGPVGLYISGNFSGRFYPFINSYADLTRPFDVICSFRLQHL